MSSLLVDSHTHLYESQAQARALKDSYVIDEYGQKPGVAMSDRTGVVEDLLDSMGKNGISYSIVLNLFITTSRGPWRVEQSPGALDGSPIEHDQSSAKRSLIHYNEWLASLAQSHEGLIPYASIDPWVLPGEEGADHVRRLVREHGVQGVKLHPNLHSIAPSAPVLLPLLQACEELGLPIVSHSGPAHGAKAGAVPSAFAPVLQEHPRLTLVLAHLGGAAWREAAGVAHSFEGVYFDCAEILPWIGASRGPRAEDVAGLIREIGAERVFLGSDFPWYEQSTHISAIMDLPGLSDDERMLILGENAARVLLTGT